MHSWMLFHGTGRILRAESDLRLLLGVISLQSRVCPRSHPNVQSTVTLSMTLLRTTSSFWLSRATKRSETPRRWTGAASVRRATPISVNTTTTPRPSASVSARRTRPSSTSRATRRVLPRREMNARAARAVMPSPSPPRASRASTSKSAKAMPVFSSRSVSSWRMSVACARSRERHASNPRRPGSSFTTSRLKRAVTSGFDFTCIRNLIHRSGYKVLAFAIMPSEQRGREASMTTELYTDLDRSIRRRFGTPGDDARVRRTAAALEANGIRVLRAADAAEAKRIVLGLIPDGSQVLHGASQSLEKSGIAEEIEKSGRYEPLRPRIWSMDRTTQADEIRRLTSAPDVMLGSVHAVTESGSLLAVSASGSQLGPYVTGAGRLILVVWTQKIVSDLEEGLRRVNEYVFPLEDARAQAAYGVHSGVNKVLIINRELVPGRITVVFVDEVLGF